MKYYDAELMQLSTVYYMVEDIKKERSYRRKLKGLLQAEELDAAYAHLFAEQTSMEQSLSFLRDCVARADTLEKQARDECLSTGQQAGLSKEDVETLLDAPLIFRCADQNALLSLGHVCVVENLVLCNTDLTENIVYLPTHIELSRVEDGYLLEATGDGESSIAVHFSHFEKQLQPIHAACASDHILFTPDTPWEYLRQYAVGIDEHIRTGLANERELALQPIVDYLTDEENASIPQELRLLASQHGADRTLQKYGDRRTKLFRNLSRREYEPMWRALLEVFEDSQKGYAQEWELYCTQEQFERHKKFVTDQMHARGFMGSYPHFCKYAPLRRIRLSSSFGESFFVGFEKHAAHHITVRAVYQDGSNGVGEKYLCGTVFRKREDEQTDIYSCMFDRRGKTNFSEVFSYTYDPDDITERALMASAAAKSAQLLPLTREERDLKRHFVNSFWTYAFMTLFLGTFFGVFMTLGFMLIELAVTLAATQSLSSFVEIFATTPWWLIGVASGVLFAIPMTVIEFLAARK